MHTQGKQAFFGWLLGNLSLFDMGVKISLTKQKRRFRTVWIERVRPDKWVSPFCELRRRSTFRHF